MTMKFNVCIMILTIALAACSGGPQLPPGAPTMANIDAMYAQINASPTPPGAILAIGSALDDSNCYGWLDQQILGSQQTSALQGVLGAGGGMAAIAGGPAGMGAAAGAGLLSAILGTAQANSPVGNDPVAAYSLILKERQAWQAAAGTPMDSVTAWSFINSYHQLCSLGGIRMAMHMAVLTAPVSATSSNQQGFTAFGAVGQQRPPTIVVGPPTLSPPSLETFEAVPRRKVRSHSKATIDDARLEHEWSEMQSVGGRTAYESLVASRSIPKMTTLTSSNEGVVHGR